MKSQNLIIISVSLLIIMAVVINLFNRLTDVDEPAPPPPIPVAPQTLERMQAVSQPSAFIPEQAPQDLIELSNSKVVCRSQVIRGVDETLLTFYRNGQSIARQTIAKDGTVTVEGTIPDGPVEIFNEYDNSKGETIYTNGKKNGTERTYYSDGVLQSETTYRNGKIKKHKEYFHSGQLRFEQDLEDALPLLNNNEVGIGKLYYPNGLLKYEWNITIGTHPGFKKSYSTDGSLRAEFYFDEQGQPMPPPNASNPTSPTLISPPGDG